MADYEKMSDRELDAAVAEKVMGWRWVQAPQYDYDGPLPEQGKVLVPPDHDDKNYQWQPKGVIQPYAFVGGMRWSTDIAAAWEVVDRVLDLAFSCFGGMTGVNLLYNPYESRWEASFDWSDSTCVNGWHEKPARAICLAALAAVEAKENTNA